MKRVLITGSNGLLGQKFVELLSNSQNYTMLLTSKQDRSVFEEEFLTFQKIDIASKQSVLAAIDGFEPDIIVKTAAVTDVDKCETERETAWRTNVTGVENIIQGAK